MSEFESSNRTATESRNEPVERNGPPTLTDRVRSLRLAGRENGGSASGSPRSAWIPWGLTVIMFITTLLFAYRTYRVGGTAVATPPVEASEDKDSSSMKTSARSSATGDTVLESKGYIVPFQTRQVSPEVGGRLEVVNPWLEEGVYFEKGTPLAYIQDVEYRADYERAAAILAEARSRLEELERGNRVEEIEQAIKAFEENEAQLSLAQKDLRRTEDLYSRGSMTRQELDKASSDVVRLQAAGRRLKASLDLWQAGPREEVKVQARARVSQASADVARAKYRLDNCVIRAPVSGIILSKKAEEGNLVNPVAFNVSATLCEMADLSNMEVDLAIQEREIARLEVGMPCLIVPEAYRNHEPFKQKHPRGYTGVLVRRMPIADRSKGSVSVRVKVDIPPGEEGIYLLPEMGAIVTFLKKQDSLAN